VNETGVTSRIPDEVRLRALMVSYQSGDLAAFDQLYALLAPPLRRFLRRHSPDADRVDDLVQETFLQIHRARHTYDTQYPLMPWVMAIARHVWLMHRRAAGRRPHATEDVDSVSLTTRAEAEGYADKVQLHAALQTLNPARRRPLIWHHVWGVSFKEIARHLGIHPDAAKLRSSRGVAELRSRLHPMAPTKKAGESE
jgi:RNA polymerase sigma-70 factor (ECF subfamily)